MTRRAPKTIIERPESNEGATPPSLNGFADENGYFTVFVSGDCHLMTREEAMDHIADTVARVLKHDPLLEANHQDMRTVVEATQVIVIGGVPFAHEEIMALLKERKSKK